MIKEFLVTVVDTNGNIFKFRRKAVYARDIIADIRINQMKDKFLHEASYNSNTIEEQFLIRTDNIVSIKVTEIKEL